MTSLAGGLISRVADTYADDLFILYRPIDNFAFRRSRALASRMTCLSHCLPSSMLAAKQALINHLLLWCCRDVTVDGYFVPAGSQVVPLLYAVHMNPELWEEPEVFRPDRFLTAEGKVFKPEQFMPFGVGRRMCLGDVLARMEIFLFFSSLLHTFDLKVPEGASLPSLRGNAGVTITPASFKVCMMKRSFDQADCDSNEIAVSGPLRNVGSH